VRALALLAAAAALAALVGCDSSEGTASARPLSIIAFKSKVAAAIVTGTDLHAEPGFGAKVDVSAEDSLNRISVLLDKPYAEYRAHHPRLDAILRSLVEDAETRMKSGNADASFAEVRGRILPVLKPGTAFRRLAEEPASMTFPGHLRVAYAVQRADAFLLVLPADLARWQQPLADIHRIALANLVRETHREQPLRCEQKLCGWASGDGYDAARFIVPELRAEIVRKIGPAVYAVPRESVYVALPIKLAGRIRERVVHDFVTASNPVSPDLFVERGGKIVALPE
jgi:hypothetical protein